MFPDNLYELIVGVIFPPFVFVAIAFGLYLLLNGYRTSSPEAINFYNYLIVTIILILIIVIIYFLYKMNEPNNEYLVSNYSKLKKITIIGYVSAIMSPVIYIYFKINWTFISENTIFKDWIMSSVPLAILAFGCGIYLISKPSKFKKHGIFMIILLFTFYISLLII